VAHQNEGHEELAEVEVWLDLACDSDLSWLVVTHPRFGLFAESTLCFLQLKGSGLLSHQGGIFLDDF
jgi:hypothetical protein